MTSGAFRFAGLREHDPEGFGGFRLLARLGEGGMGQVFLALSPGGVPAAVKVIRSEFTREPEFADRFAREIAAAQRVRGAHIASLLDADARAARPWLATSYVAGPSLRDLVLGTGRLPERQVLLLAGGIAHALTDIHAAGVVHRDLKPANIVLDETGPKVIDFGIVKSLSQSVTQVSHSTRIGTPLYMSPEQAMGRAVGPASDVFALGSTLYHLATGREAFGAENEWAVAHRVAADAPDLSTVTAPLRHLIADCLGKDPARRPTPEQIRLRCEALLGGAPNPGAWRGIDGAHAAVRERTDALRALTAPTRPGPPGGPDGTRPKAPDSLPPEPPSRRTAPGERPPQSPPDRPADAPPAELTKSLLLLAVPALVSASRQPVMEQTFTLASTGAEKVRVLLSLDWHRPFAPTGTSPDPGDWLIPPLGVIGTAVAIVLAAAWRYGTARRPGALADAAGVGAMIWAALAVLFFVTFPLDHGADTGYTAVDRHLMTGGWLLLVANLLVLATGGVMLWWEEIRPTWRPKPTAAASD
ncbi:serine/threonine-protein kinase [Kitasatospora sp. NPDC096147]|uniref:serine/threonine-protein kinase n=1 Tax=Kitasatospora sp. NPDC096147 TaxID=3364093 RepID=UPI0037FB6FED